MIEIIDTQDKPQKLDITPQLAISAIKVVKQYAEGIECGDCAYQGEICKHFRRCPQDWPEIEQKQGGDTNGQKDVERLPEEQEGACSAGQDPREASGASGECSGGIWKGDKVQ